MPIFLEALALSRDTLLEFIKRYEDGVDFVTLPRFFFDKGEFYLKSKRNHVYWKGVSKTLAEDLLWLVSNGHVQYITCSALEYFRQFASVPLPVAKQSGRTYTKEHWLPVKLIAVNKKGKDSGESSGKGPPGRLPGE